MSKKWTIILRTQGKNIDFELKNAINSIIAQTYNNLSVIITIHSDNEKTIQDTLAFLEPFKKILDFTPVVLKSKQGNRAYPLNAALNKVDSEYLSFLDDDDRYYPNMGTDLIQLLEQNNINFAIGSSINTLENYKYDNFGNRYLYTISKEKRISPEFNTILFLMNNFIPFNSFILRCSLIGKTKFDERLEYLEDWDFLKNLALKKDFKFIQVDIPVSEYRRQNNQTDTFNEKNYTRWLKARQITDNNFKEKEITIKIGELLEIKDSQDFSDISQKKIDCLYEEINRISLNPAYKLWVSLRDNKIINKTIRRFIRMLKK